MLLKILEQQRYAYAILRHNISNNIFLSLHLVLLLIITEERNTTRNIAVCVRPSKVVTPTSHTVFDIPFSFHYSSVLKLRPASNHWFLVKNFVLFNRKTSEIKKAEHFCKKIVVPRGKKALFYIFWFVSEILRLFSIFLHHLTIAGRNIACSP